MEGTRPTFEPVSSSEGQPRPQLQLALAEGVHVGKIASCADGRFSDLVLRRVMP